MRVPPLLMRHANGTRSLVIDVGLDKGVEFFYAIDHGFEVVGLEPNPISFQYLAEKCSSHPACEVLTMDQIQTTTISAIRKPGKSYLLNAGAGNARGTMELALRGAVGSVVKESHMLKGPGSKANVTIVRIDEIIDEDVFLFKVDTQGFDHWVLQGAVGLFQRHVVRQVMFEYDAYMNKLQGIRLQDTLKMLKHLGMLCFLARSDVSPQCRILTDSPETFEKFVSKGKVVIRDSYSICFDDALCLNTKKLYPGIIPQLSKN